MSSCGFLIISWKCCLYLYWELSFFAGATTDSVLEGVNAKPDLFPENTKDVPDINFFYRYSMKGKVCDRFCCIEVLTVSSLSCRSTQVTASCDQGRSSVITVRCNPEKSEQGELSVPRYVVVESVCESVFSFLLKMLFSLINEHDTATYMTGKCSFILHIYRLRTLTLNIV